MQITLQKHTWFSLFPSKYWIELQYVKMLWPRWIAKDDPVEVKSRTGSYNDLVLVSVAYFCSNYDEWRALRVFTQCTFTCMCSSIHVQEHRALCSDAWQYLLTSEIWTDSVTVTQAPGRFRCHLTDTRGMQALPLRWIQDCSHATFCN